MQNAVDNLLEIAVGVHSKASAGADWQEVSNAVVADIIQQRRNPDLSLRAILLLATADWCRPDKPLSAHLRERLLQVLGYRVPVVGASVPRIFVSLPPKLGHEEPSYYEVSAGFAAIGLFSNDLWITPGCVEKPGELSEPERKERINEMAAQLQREARHEHIGLGTSAAADLFAIFPGPFQCPEVGLCSHDTELHQLVIGAFQDSLALYGASAANALESADRGYQFFNDECLESSLVVALLEYEFKVGSSMAHGLRADPLKRTYVTGLAAKGAVEDYVITTLDHKPAAERLREIYGDAGMKTPRPTLGNGIALHTRVVTPLVFSPEASGPVRLNRKVTLGFALTILTATPEELFLRAQEAQRDAVHYSSALKESVRLILGFACIGRFLMYERQQEGGWWKAARELAGEFAQRYPLVYALVAGEFGETRRRRPRAENFSVSFVCLTGESNQRASNRLLQAKLLDYAGRIGAEREVDAVMGETVNFAVKAGASGGQICICDPASMKILGAPHGYAAPRKDLKAPNFAGIASSTCRDLLKDGDVYALNEKLKHWSIETGSRPKEKRRIALGPGADILSIVCANRIAVYVPNSNDPDFYCDSELIRRAGIEEQLVMPLIGSKHQVIATLQLGFPGGTGMNGELMRSWLAYAQQSAAVLERAFEYRAREMMEFVTKLATVTMQQEAPTHAFPECEIEAFLKDLQELIGADYVHLRIREESEPALTRYRLVAPPGRLADEHKAARLFIEKEQGSLAHVWDRGRVQPHTATLSETLLEYLSQPGPTRTHLTPNRPWSLDRQEFKVFCVQRLGEGELPDGALVLHSQKEYFFTQRRLDLIEQASIQLLNLIRKREADYNERERQNLRDHLTAIGTLWAKTGHDLSRPLAKIGLKVEYLQRTLGAEGALAEDFAYIRTQVERATEVLRKRTEGVDLGNAPIRLPALFDQVRSEAMEVWDGNVRYEGQAQELSVISNFWVRSSLANLLDNAIEHAREKENGQIWVVVKPPGGAGMVHIDIANDGKVVTEQELAAMHTLGFSSKKGHLGLGVPLAAMGLASVRGELCLFRRPEGGLVVTAKIPVASSEDLLQQGGRMCYAN